MNRFPFFSLYGAMRIHANPLQFQAISLSQFRKKKHKQYVHYSIMPIFLLNLCFKILLYTFYSGRHALKQSDYQRQTLIFVNWISFHPNKFICISYFSKAYTVHGCVTLRQEQQLVMMMMMMMKTKCASTRNAFMRTNGVCQREMRILSYIPSFRFQAFALCVPLYRAKVLM